MRNNRILAALLAVLMAVLLLPAQALAADRIDLSHDASLTISYQDAGTPLAGAAFSIYHVATVDEYGTLIPTGAFASFNVNIQGENDAAWRTLASTLEGYVLRDNIAPTDSGTTDAQGLLIFPTQQSSLPLGLYMVLGQRLTQNGTIYDPQPFLVHLPVTDQETNTWQYDLAVNPKYESQPEPDDETVIRKVLKVWADDGHEQARPDEITVQLLCDGEVADTITLSAENSWRYTWENLDAAHQWTVVEQELEGYTAEVTQEGVTFIITNTYDEDGPGPNTPPSNNEPPLPQTGQLWWPVPLLIAAGLLLLVVGLLRRRGANDEA